MPLLATKLHTCLNGDGTVESLSFLGSEISHKCLAAVLGIGKSRLKRGMDCAVDLRFGKQRSESRKDTWSVDAFLALQYEGVAETLPDRRGP